ncbi:MAG: DUF3048 domain-containing protein [bacterium]
MEGNIDFETQADSVQEAPSAFLKSKASFFSHFNAKKMALFGGAALGLGALLFGGWLVFAKATNRPMPSASFTLSSEENAGKGTPTIANPINGILYTSTEVRQWQERRPMAVTINNHAEARPQKGLSSADLIYEAVAEGGISRFLAIFHSKLPETVGPVRSARVYYIDWAKEYDAWYAHWGHAQGSNEANAFARMQQIFVSSIESAKACDYDDTLDRALEHTLYCETENLYTTAYELYPDQPTKFGRLVSWDFKDEPKSAGVNDKAVTINLNFWDLPEYAVEWRYVPESNSYERYQAGEKQADAINSATLTARNIIVEFMPEKQLADVEGHLIYNDIGTGDALIFLDGRVVEAEWRRLAYTDRTIFTDNVTGKEVEFNRGQVWVEVVPQGSEDNVSYD